MLSPDLCNITYKFQPNNISTVFKISSAVRSRTLNTTQSTSLLKLHTISLCLWSKKVLHVNKRQTEMHITLPIPIILLPPTWVFCTQLYLLTGDSALCSYNFLIRVILCYTRDKCLWTYGGMELTCIILMHQILLNLQVTKTRVLVRCSHLNAAYTRVDA